MYKYNTQLVILGLKYNDRYYVYKNNGGHATRGELLISDLPTVVNYAIVYPMETHANYDYELDKKTELVYLTVAVKSETNESYTRILTNLLQMESGDCNKRGLHNVKVSLVEETKDRYHWLAENAKKLGLPDVITTNWNEVFLFDYPKTGANSFADIKKLYKIFGHPKLSIGLGNIQDLNYIGQLPDWTIEDINFHIIRDNNKDSIRELLSKEAPTYCGTKVLLRIVQKSSMDIIPKSYIPYIINLKGVIWWSDFVQTYLVSENPSDYLIDGVALIKYKYESALADSESDYYDTVIKDPQYKPTPDKEDYYEGEYYTTDDRIGWVEDILGIYTPVITADQFKQISYLWKGFSQGMKEVLYESLVIKEDAKDGE